MAKRKKVSVSSEWTLDERKELKGAIYCEMLAMANCLSEIYLKSKLSKIINLAWLLDSEDVDKLEEKRADYQELREDEICEWSEVERVKIWWALYFSCLNADIRDFIQFYGKNEIYIKILVLFDLCITINEGSADSLEKGRDEFKKFIKSSTSQDKT